MEPVCNVCYDVYMNILEVIDTYVNAVVTLRIELTSDNASLLESDVSNKFEAMKSEFEKADLSSLKMCKDALEQAIDSTRLEIDSLSSRYMLGVTQKNVAIFNNDKDAEQRYIQMIEETLAHSKQTEALCDAYKDALKEVTGFLSKGRG